MSKFDNLKASYLAKGISSDNIDFVIDAVKSGTRRPIIIESLMEDYRGLTQEQSVDLLEAAYAVYGGEFKRENRFGYLYAVVLLTIGILCTFVLVITYDGATSITAPGRRYILIGAGFGIIGGILSLARALQGKFRDEHVKI